VSVDPAVINVVGGEVFAGGATVGPFDPWGVRPVPDTFPVEWMDDEDALLLILAAAT
jgi:hypothetical protein